MRITTWHTIATDRHGRPEGSGGYEPQPARVLVATWEMDRVQDHLAVVCETTFELLNGGDDPTFGTPDARPDVAQPDVAAAAVAALSPGSPEPNRTGVVTEPAADRAQQPAREPRLVAVIEWPSESGEEPTLIFGPTPQALDRAVIGLLRDETSYGLPGDVDDELGDFVRDNPLPPTEASAEDNLRWLTAMRSALISTSVTLYTVPRSGRASAHEYAGRYSDPTS